MERTKRRETLTICVSKREKALIQTAFEEENLSKVVRDFLLGEAEVRMQETDIAIQTEDPGAREFLAILPDPAVQQTLYSLFKAATAKEAV